MVFFYFYNVRLFVIMFSWATRLCAQRSSSKLPAGRTRGHVYPTLFFVLEARKSLCRIILLLSFNFRRKYWFFETLKKKKKTQHFQFILYIERARVYTDLSRTYPAKVYLRLRTAVKHSKVQLRVARTPYTVLTHLHIAYDGNNIYKCVAALNEYVCVYV